jgi:hypothetical protein
LTLSEAAVVSSVDRILTAFTRVTRAGKGWLAQCPAHEDAKNSLSIGRGDDGRLLLKCFAGCTFDAILAAAHLTRADVRAPGRADRPDRRIVTAYDYLDERGVLAYQNVRYQPKDFKVRRPDGAGGYIWDLRGVRRVLYRLPELQGKHTVFVTEGEEDTNRLWREGLPATTCAGGAGSWRVEFAMLLSSAGVKQVVVLPDNDAAGASYGRAVARSCADAGLDVKLVPLPGLPDKGDVSDYLEHHTKDELLAIVRDAPLFDPHRRVTEAPPLTLTSLADLLAEPDDAIDWLVEDRIPAGGVVLLVAAPKAGKSTFARELAAAVAGGGRWLGWRTTRGTVWMLIFQDKRSEVRKHLRRLGVTGNEAIRFFIDQAPADLLPRLHDLAKQERPALIVVDMLAGLLPVKDLNDYAQVSQKFEPLLHLSRDSGAGLLLLHHGSAHGVAREGLDAALGSTALSGSVDNVLVLRRVDGHRVLSSVQRIGPDLEPTIVTLSADTGRLELAGSKRDVDDEQLGKRILDALAQERAPVFESALQANVEGRKSDQVRVLRRLLGAGKVHRLGAGGRKDPYRYVLVPECAWLPPGSPEPWEPREPDESSGSQIPGAARNSANAREPQSTPANIDLFATFGVQVPRFPIRVPEPELQNPVRTTSEGTSDSHDPSVVVPKVPGNSQKPLNGTPPTTQPTEKTASIQVPKATREERSIERF